VSGAQLGFMAPPAWLDDTWMSRAACRGKDRNIFFPGAGRQHAEALAICHGCPVRVECLEYALVTDSSGVWGGTSERERDRIRKRRHRAVA
jgi:WhiB family redox-sensing transcriptional regulator